MEPDKVGRSAFLYLEPTSTKDAKEFAQCETCVMFTGSRCMIHGPDLPIGEYDSCNFYVEGKPEKDMAGKEMTLVVPVASGLVKDIQVRCENCASFSDGDCQLFASLAKQSPSTFDLGGSKVLPKACCNAWRPASISASLHAAGNADALIKWYEEGADGKIDWGSPGDFEQCVSVASPHVDDPEAFCQSRHIGATGMSTSEHAHSEKASLDPVLSHVINAEAFQWSLHRIDGALLAGEAALVAGARDGHLDATGVELVRSAVAAASTFYSDALPILAAGTYQKGHLPGAPDGPTNDEARNTTPAHLIDYASEDYAHGADHIETGFHIVSRLKPDEPITDEDLEALKHTLDHAHKHTKDAADHTERAVKHMKEAPAFKEAFDKLSAKKLNVAPKKKQSESTEKEAPKAASAYEEVGELEYETELNGLKLKLNISEEALVAAGSKGWSGIVLTEGVPSSSGEMYLKGSITWRVPPMPLYVGTKFQGDGDDFDADDYKFDDLVGRVDRIERDASGNILASGTFSATDANMAIQLLTDGALTALIPICAGTEEYTVSYAQPYDTAECDSCGDNDDEQKTFAKAEIVGLALVPISDYANSRVALVAAAKKKPDHDHSQAEMQAFKDKSNDLAAHLADDHGMSEPDVQKLGAKQVSVHTNYHDMTYDDASDQDVPLNAAGKFSTPSMSDGPSAPAAHEHSDAQLKSWDDDPAKAAAHLKSAHHKNAIGAKGGPAAYHKRLHSQTASAMEEDMSPEMVSTIIAATQHAASHSHTSDDEGSREHLISMHGIDPAVVDDVDAGLHSTMHQNIGRRSSNASDADDVKEATKDGTIASAEQHVESLIAALVDADEHALVAAVDQGDWSGSTANFSDAQYKAAAAACDSGGGATTKQQCALPHHNPGGQLNAKGLASAVAYLGKTKMSAAAKAKAKAHLRSHYKNDLKAKDENLPDSLSASIVASAEEIEQAAIVASSIPAFPPAEWFSNPNLEGPTPMTVTQDGRVFGHLAARDTCHTGYRNQCVKPPLSASGYRHFLVGVRQTADGNDVPVGHLTMDTGHASMEASAPAAAAHYDDTGTVVADVNCGEDRYGIWVAGALRPDLSESQIIAMRAAAISGDWRPIRGKLELVAALLVNVPGFPIPRVAAMVASGEDLRALVAADIVLPIETVDEEEDDLIVAALERVERKVDHIVQAPVRRAERQSLLEKVTPITMAASARRNEEIDALRAKACAGALSE